MYDPGKLKSLLLYGGIVMIAIFVANAALVLITLAWPDWLPRQFFGLEFIADNRQRAQTAAAQYRDGTIGQDEPFVVILGLSSASEGITLTGLPQRTGDGTRFLGLTGGGRNMRDLARYAQPLIASEAQPEMAILAINLFHLMDPPPAMDSIPDNLRKPETIRALRGYWLTDRRQDIKYAVDSGIDGVNNAVFSFFDVQRDRDNDPWREVMRMGLPQATDDDQWQDKVDSYGERGYYEAGNYRRSQNQMCIVDTIVTDFLTSGTAVVVMLMPEHSRLRNRIPADAMGLFEQELKNRHGEAAPAIIDFRDAVADPGFKDISHMNEQGRLMFAPLFADAIATQLTNIR